MEKDSLAAAHQYLTQRIEKGRIEAYLKTGIASSMLPFVEAQRAADTVYFDAVIHRLTATKK